VLALFAGIVVVVGVGFVVVLVRNDTPTGASSSRRTAVAIAPSGHLGSAPVRPVPYPDTGRMTPPVPTSRRRLTGEETGCRIGQGPTQLPTVTSAVSDRVNRAWERIEKWLSAHTHVVLPPPADPQRIVDMQRQAGAPIPAELVASLLRHDGAPNGFTLPPFYLPISAQEIGKQAAMMCDVLMSLDLPDDVGSWWHGQYVPFAVDNSGESLFFDERAGHNGRLGEHDNEGEVNFDRWPPTLTELLEQTAEGLETGHTVLNSYRAKVTDGALGWEIIR
jgi:cell wall assembly regulator SMI1